MSDKFIIRFAEPSDTHQLVELCQLHANYEKSTYSKSGKVEKLQIDLFSDHPKLYCLVVENEEKLIAYTTYMKQYATWDAGEYIYMDCLFVKECYRGQNLGERLIRSIQEEGKQLGCDLIQWQTPDFNVRAMKFYNRIGASSKTKERFFLKRDHLED